MLKELEDLFHEFNAKLSRRQKGEMIKLKNAAIDYYEHQIKHIEEDAYDRGWNKAVDYLNGVRVNRA